VLILVHLSKFPLLSNPHIISISTPDPYMPPAPAPLCKCPKYCLLVVFHAAMYFSMQLLKLVDSADEMDEPGLGIARSKQCSLTFCNRRL
jgi:hypothetical protein